jgi:integrase
MPRPKKDGTPPRAPRASKLSEILVRRVRPEPTALNIWDTYQRGLVLRVQPSGARAFKAVYRHRGRARWFHIGDAAAIGLADARKLAAEVMLSAARGNDPVAERRAERNAGTVADVAARYVETYAKRRNKSWQQADTLVRRYLLPRWGKLHLAAITRADVRAMVSRIDAPVLANQVLAATSAIFSWAMKQDIVDRNPCVGVDRNPTKARERVLSDGEIVRFWPAFDDAGVVAGAALKVLLLTGQRPGEVACMRREHIRDGWWDLPGEPVPKLGWPGTKNKQTHRVWLSRQVRALIAAVDDNTVGFAFPGPRGRPIGGPGLARAMRAACRRLGVDEKATPHDLRRTFSSKVTALGYGRDAMNRVTNHKEGGIASVYDRHHYAVENQRIWEAISENITAVAAASERTASIIPMVRP